MKKVTEVCDICEHTRPIVETVNNKDYMPEIALEVIKYDSIGYLNWDADSNEMEDDLNEILNKY